jgi:uncharacterized protein YjbI with pentapeptide repeats
LTNLRGANLQEAKLDGANLYRADLSNADLSEAILTGVDLSKAILSEAILSETHPEDAQLDGANLSWWKRVFNLFKSRLSLLQSPLTKKPIDIGGKVQ